MYWNFPIYCSFHCFFIYGIHSKTRNSKNICTIWINFNTHYFLWHLRIFEIIKWMYITENRFFLSDKHRIIICAVIAIMVRHCFLLFLTCFFTMMDETWLTNVLLPCLVTMAHPVKKEAKSILSLYTGEYSSCCCFDFYLMESCDQTAS